MAMLNSTPGHYIPLNDASYYAETDKLFRQAEKVKDSIRDKEIDNLKSGVVSELCAKSFNFRVINDMLVSEKKGKNAQSIHCVKKFCAGQPLAGTMLCDRHQEGNYNSASDFDPAMLVDICSDDNESADENSHGLLSIGSPEAVLKGDLYERMESDEENVEPSAPKRASDELAEKVLSNPRKFKDTQCALAKIELFQQLFG